MNPHPNDFDDVDDEIIDGEIVEVGTEIEAVASEIDYRSGLAQIRRGIAHLDDQRAAMFAAGDVDGLAWGAVNTGTVRNDLSTLQHSMRSDIARLLAFFHGVAGGSKFRNPKHFVPDLGEIKVPGGKERKNWNSKPLFQELMRHTLYDENGELKFDSVAEAIQAVEDMLFDCLGFTGSMSWKVGQWDAVAKVYKGGIRSRGFDPEDWCDETDRPKLADLPKKEAS